jgi:hypothetical protein
MTTAVRRGNVEWEPPENATLTDAHATSSGPTVLLANSDPAGKVGVAHFP